MQSPRWKHSLGAVTLLCVSLLLAFVGGEVLLRLLGHRGEPQSIMQNVLPVSDNTVDWRYQPNSEVSIGTVMLRYNTEGFRDTEHAKNKPAGIKRTLVLGDSVTMGYGVEWPAMFSTVVQAGLPANHEVITLAMGGLNTPQEVYLFENIGLKYEIDLLVVNFVLNDADFPTRYEASRRFLEGVDSRIGLFNLKVDPELKRFLKSSALIYFVKESVEILKGRIYGYEDKDHYTKVWESPSNREKVSSSFGQLRNLQSQHKFSVVVIIWPILMKYEQYRYAEVHKWVRQQAENSGFDVIDLLRDFSEHSHRDLQLNAEDNVHPNQKGHLIAARAFLAWYYSHDSTQKGGSASH